MPEGESTNISNEDISKLADEIVAYRFPELDEGQRILKAIELTPSLAIFEKRADIIHREKPHELAENIEGEVIVEDDKEK